MPREFRPPLAILFWNLDFWSLVVAYYITYTITFGDIDIIRSFMFLPDYYLLSFWVNVISWIYFSHYFQLYESNRLFMSENELLDVLKAVGMPVVLAAIPPLFSRSVVDAPHFFIILYALQALSLLFLRFLIRTFLKYMHNSGYNYRQVLIVGCNDRSARLAQRIQLFPALGHRIVGFIDAPHGKCHSNCNYTFNILGNLEDCERIIRENIVDEVFLMLPIKSFYSEIEEIIELCATVGIEAKIPTDIFRLSSFKPTISQYLYLTVINLYNILKMSAQLILKRTIDIILSLCLLVLLLPVLFTVAVLIKLTAKGSILFKQQRAGCNGQTFTLYEFSTVINSSGKLQKGLSVFNEMDGPVFKPTNDLQLSRVGSYLRKTGMDKIPQLINVLKGDMSLVGPELPVPPDFDPCAAPDRRRLSMKPGITGIRQVSGSTTVLFTRRLEMDLEYIDQWSLWLDLKILFRTLIPADPKREDVALDLVHVSPLCDGCCRQRALSPDPESVTKIPT
jgi:exopolysaccharide biosynthesis polyprenyl glycosylphosphotransferase